MTTCSAMEFNNSFFSNSYFPTSFMTVNSASVPEIQKAPKKFARKNPWGNRSYADLIAQAILSSPEQRLTLSQIYDWMTRNIPFFENQVDSSSSAGWKNSIRHNLSLHKKFRRIRNDATGKSSWWTVNPEAGTGRSPRRKGSSRRKRTKGITQCALENISIPLLFKNNRCKILGSSQPQRNVWGTREHFNAWNNSSPPTASSETTSQSSSPPILSDESRSNSIPENPLDCYENAQSNSSMYYDPFSERKYFSTNTYQSSQTYTEQFAYGGIQGSYRASLQEQFIFRQAAAKPAENKTTWKDYFMSPHHLSGSYITIEEEKNKNNFCHEIETDVGILSVFTHIKDKDKSKQTSILKEDSEEDVMDFLLKADVSDINSLNSVLNEIRNIQNECDISSNPKTNSLIQDSKSSNHEYSGLVSNPLHDVQGMCVDKSNVQIEETDHIDNLLRGTNTRNAYSSLEEEVRTSHKNVLLDSTLASNRLEGSQDSVTYSDSSKFDDRSNDLNTVHIDVEDLSVKFRDQIIQKCNYSPIDVYYDSQISQSKNWINSINSNACENSGLFDPEIIISYDVPINGSYQSSYDFTDKVVNSTSLSQTEFIGTAPKSLESNNQSDTTKIHSQRFIRTYEQSSSGLECNISAPTSTVQSVNENFDSSRTKIEQGFTIDSVDTLESDLRISSSKPENCVKSIDNETFSASILSFMPSKIESCHCSNDATIVVPFQHQTKNINTLNNSDSFPESIFNFITPETENCHSFSETEGMYDAAFQQQTANGSTIDDDETLPVSMLNFTESETEIDCSEETNVLTTFSSEKNIVENSHKVSKSGKDKENNFLFRDTVDTSYFSNPFPPIDTTSQSTVQEKNALNETTSSTDSSTSFNSEVLNNLKPLRKCHQIALDEVFEEILHRKSNYTKDGIENAVLEIAEELFEEEMPCDFSSNTTEEKDKEDTICFDEDTDSYTCIESIDLYQDDSTASVSLQKNKQM